MWKWLTYPVVPHPRARWLLYPLLLVALWLWQGQRLLQAGPNNGFDLSGSLVPVSQIEPGGPPRDGIPAIDHPRFLNASQADFLRDEDRVLGIDRNGLQKAYPVRVLNYHEIVNDRFGDTAVVVSYCPLCGTGMAFLAARGNENLNFGVSGLLYNSDVLLYDRQTESLWSQLLGRAVTGPLKGQRLQQIPMEHTSWADWRRRHPRTLVLSTDTGYQRDYSRSPYAGYADSDRLMFGVSRLDRRFPPKEWVLGIELGGEAKAYPFSTLARGPARFEDRLGGKTIRILFDASHRSARAYLGEQAIPVTTGFWFAWAAFHPDTQVYTGPSP
ncbi:MAG TPA: DUF3179 domain-containing protein [Gammaproteobacteria bacterium]|nr:DUF3179 domain-containing protein [Gammaproteobacteria bacterium]